MLGLPQKTEYNKRIPKLKFYEHLSLTTAQKRVFIDQIKEIYWRNILAERTLNLAPGKAVKEIHVVEIRLTGSQLDESVLRLIDKKNANHILFLLEHKGKYQAWIAYKERAKTGENAFKVGNYYHTDWRSEEDLQLKIEGLNLDSVYENFVRQVAGDALQTDKTEPLKESVERDARRKELEKKIKLWEAKLRREKQFNKKVMLNGELKVMKKELTILNGEKK